MPLVYLTDLNTAYDRYFATRCMEYHLPIHVMLPHKYVERLYSGLPAIEKQIVNLVDYAHKVEVLHKGGYSPKKHIRTDAIIAGQSDLVVAVHSKKFPFKSSIPQGIAIVNLYEDERD